MRHDPSSLTGRLAFALLAISLGACGTARHIQQPAAAPPVHIEMEPMVIEAVTGPEGPTTESYDAAGLFEEAGAALSRNEYDRAIELYTKLLTRFPESSYARPAMYNRGLAHRDKRDWQKAIDSFRALVDKHESHVDAKDGLFQMGACYAELENWPASGEVFARLLERADLNADDRIEAIARRGFAQFKLGDLDLAERTFRSAMAYRQQIEAQERLTTDFFLAFSQYNLGQITHERFRQAPIRLPERQMDQDLEVKAGLLLKAQRSYIDTIKFGNARWASAAGFQVGSLYEELYAAFVGAPIPPKLTAEEKKVYLEELHKKIRVLLEKSLRWYRENLLMVERLGVDTDWAEKTKLSYAKLLKLLDPEGKEHFEGRRPHLDPGQAPPPPSATPPAAPDRERRPPEQAPAETPTSPANPDRQIL